MSLPRSSIVPCLIASLLVMGLAAPGKASPGPWNLDQLFEPPVWEKTDLAPKAGLQALLYNSVSFDGAPVQVFAYYNAPKGKAPKGGWPAVVCIHGGGGTAFDWWVEKWNAHGYAAISMDLEGHLPLAAKGGKGRLSTPHPGPSRNGVFHDFAEPVERQWYYHAVAQVVLAHSLMASFPEVNAEKIGVTGISWGGTLTSTVMGVDKRFAFAIPGYGCGFLSDSSGHQGRAIADGAHKELVDRLYDGSAYFANVGYPTFWVNGTNDFHFDLPAMQQSSRAVNGPVTLRFELGMGHGHGPVANTEECYIFADSVVKGGTPLAKVERPTASGDAAEVRFQSAVPLKKAELQYTTDAESIWPDKKWHALPATVGDGVVTATLPAGTFAFLFALTDERDAMVSSEFLEHSVEGAPAGDSVAEQGDAAVDFDALFETARSKPGATVLIAENFEDGVSETLSAMLKVEDPEGKAGIGEWYDAVASGGKSLRMVNAATVAQAFQPSLGQWLRGPRFEGLSRINVSVDLMIPSDGGSALSLIARDFGKEPAVEFAHLLCTAKGFRLGGLLKAGAEDQWRHVALSIPAGSGNAEADLTFIDAEFGKRTFTVPLSRGASEAPDWFGLLLGGRNDGVAYIDNLVISVER